MNTKKARMVQKARWEYPLRIAQWWQEHMRNRIQASRRLFGGPRFYRGDCHSHSTFSDGIGTVAEMHRMKLAAGLDFLFITDHWGVAQKTQCAKFPQLWWGQEPPTQHHHIGILDSQRALKTRADLPGDIARARRLGRLVYVAHPAGWYPVTRYSREQMDALFQLGDEFCLEIVNGANQMFDNFDVTDEAAIALWDELLGAGRRVHGLGNTDSHLPHNVGSVWTGVFCSKLAKDAVITALGKGRCFVSEAPLLHLEVRSGSRRAGMGQTLAVSGGKVTVRYRAADSFGLQLLRVVQDGKPVREIDLARHPVADGTVPLRVGPRSRFVRIECYAKDWRRAFSNPVYFR